MAENLREIRGLAKMSTREMSRLLDGAGRPIAASGITKIETGGDSGRRVDADDLMALAVVLCSTPNRLLLTPTSSPQPVALTENVIEPQSQAWAWANGKVPLNYHLGPTSGGGIRPTSHVNAIQENLLRRGQPHRSSAPEMPPGQPPAMAVEEVAEMVLQVATRHGVHPLVLLSQAQILLVGATGSQP